MSAYVYRMGHGLAARWWLPVGPAILKMTGYSGLIAATIGDQTSDKEKAAQTDGQCVTWAKRYFTEA